MTNALPGSSGADPLITLWQDLSLAIASGDTQQIQNVIQDVMMLTPSDKQLLENLASVIPYPGIPPFVISQVFSNPEATIGVIERLGPKAVQAELNTLLGMVENAVTFSAVLEYLQSNTKLSQDVKTQTLTGTSNPINVALHSFVQNGGFNKVSFNGSSIQFLQDNPILLSALKTADPALLNQAYTLASGQLALSLFSQLGSPPPSDQAPPLSPAQQLYQGILYALEHDQLSMNQGVVMLLQFLVTIQAGQGTLALAMPSTRQQPMPNTTTNNLSTTTPLTTTTNTLSNAIPITPANTVASAIAIPITPANIVASAIPPIMPANTTGTAIPITPANTVANVTNDPGVQQTATITPQKASTLALSAIAASWSTAASSIFEGQGVSLPPQAVNQLAMLLTAAQQMAVYWQIPGAVSLMRADGGQVTEDTISNASVRSFAIAIGVFVNSPDFENILTVIIKQNMPNLTEEQLATIMSAVKITFLMPALIALYITMLRKTQGQFSAQELKDMLLGKIPIPPDDPLLEGIIKSIQAELLQIPEENQDAFLANLLAGYNENTDLGELTNPSNIFLRLCDPTYFLDQTASESV